MPTQHGQNLKKVYNDIADLYNRQQANNLNRPYLNYFLSLLPPKSNLLDLGSGHGRDSAYFISQGHQTTIADISEKLMNIALKKVPTAHSIVGDMIDLNFSESSFDGVWANASLLHLTKVEAHTMVAKIYYWLKAGGIFFVSFKEGNEAKEIIDTKYLENSQTITRFFSFYQLPELEALLSSSHFSVIRKERSYTSNNQPWVVAFAQKK